LLQEHAEGTQALPAQVQEDLKGIYANARHLGRLISDVLDLASSDAGQLRLTWDLVDLSEVLRGVADMGRQLAADKGLTWRASFPESGPWVRGDRTRLQQVALNLVANAVKFTAQGEVHLHLEEEVGAATVYVRDTGLGLSPEEQQAIFDEFQRSERSVRRGYGGIGLGLAICKRLVNLHGGQIGVRSSGVEGAGSEFYFRLPTVAAPARAPQELPPEEDAPPRIMALSAHGEDQQLQEHLTRRGFQVTVYAMEESDAWLNELLQRTYTAVLLHVDREDPAGWQVIKLLKANPVTQEIPTLFYAADESRAAVLELDYLTKPIELAALTRAIEQHR
ncbi:MAG: hybrid sensor histidine kinase/response regulator, partial [Caldilineae bacterium]